MPHPIRPGDFTRLADLYARTRPSYPTDLVDRLIQHAAVQPGDDVVDIGAGTGLWTTLLAQRGLRVTAIEPNLAMRQRAPALPGVAWQDGTFEQTGLANAAFPWVTAAQAFHWARLDQALPEMRRILTPGGRLTVLWNDRDTQGDPVVAHTHQIILRLVPEFSYVYRTIDWSEALTATGDFHDVSYDEADHVITMSRARYLDLWRSHNTLNAAAGPERFDQFMAELAAYLQSEHVEQIPVPYRTRAWTVTRT